MVSKDSVIETNTRCVCGNGDIYNFQKNYFKNICPNCGKEGTLQLETENNVELSNNSFNEENNTNNTNSNTTDTNQENNTNNSTSTKIVCKNCGSQYCGQDGYDIDDPNRNSLSYVNPNEITDEDEDSEASSTEEGETTYMSGWEGLCDLLKPLDGQAMMLQRGDFVIIKKIEMPQSARLWAYEGINVVDDSVTVTDYTPEIYNTFIIKWGESFENELEFVFEKHKRLFGERKIVIEAKKYQVVGEDENSEGDNKDEENKDNGGSVLDWIFGSSNEEEQLKNTDTSNVPLGDDATDLSSTGEGEEAPQTEEVPITDREEAKRFGLTQVGKAKREDGHTIELKVIGNHNWQMGEWCHVRLPKFNEDSYMFISKCSFESSADSEYICSLTLVDYPPSLGKPSKKEQNNSSDESDSTTDTDTDSSNDNNTDNEGNNDNGNNNNSNNNNDNNTN